MKTDKYKKVLVGDYYNQHLFDKEVFEDLQTVKEVLHTLINRIDTNSIFTAQMQELREKLDEK